MDTKKTKILHTIRQGDFGGGETYLYNLVTRLDKSLFEPVVLSFTEGAMVDRLKKEGIRTYVIPTLQPFNFFTFPAVRRILKKEKIDILHIHGTRAGTNTLIPALFNKIKVIYTVHGWSFHTGQSGLITQLRMLSERFLTHGADKTICGSASDIAQGKTYCSKGNYQLIRNSVDTQKFNPSLQVKNLREEFGLTDNELVVSFIARLTFQKDPLTFIKAISSICKKVPFARFMIVGDGDLKEACIKLAVQLNVADKIIFLPFRADVKEILQLTDVFVLPSLWEVIPLGLLEAMSMEKSCIATNIAGTNEALKDNYNGFLVDVHAPEQIARKVTMLAYNPLLRRKLGKNARNTVMTQFDIQLLVKENEKVYLKLSGRIADRALSTSDLSVALDNPLITG